MPWMLIEAQLYRLCVDRDQDRHVTFTYRNRGPLNAMLRERCLDLIDTLGYALRDSEFSPCSVRGFVPPYSAYTPEGNE
jgi:hypothetical protein